MARALAEDIGSGDVTASLLADDPQRGYVVAKESAVVAGRPWFDACFFALDPGVKLHWLVADGDAVPAGTVVVEFEGRTRALLGAERCALNEAITVGGLKRVDGSPQSTPIKEGLITRDHKTVYRIEDGIPVLLSDEGIATASIAEFPR